MRAEITTSRFLPENRSPFGMFLFAILFITSCKKTGDFEPEQLATSGYAPTIVADDIKFLKNKMIVVRPRVALKEYVKATNKEIPNVVGKVLMNVRGNRLAFEVAAIVMTDLRDPNVSESSQELFHQHPIQLAGSDYELFRINPDNEATPIPAIDVVEIRIEHR